MVVMNVPSPLLNQLMHGLNGTVNDAKERLCYCAEMKVRLEVQLFEPLPSHLNYPELLVENNKPDVSNDGSGSSNSKSSVSSTTGDMIKNSASTTATTASTTTTTSTTAVVMDQRGGDDDHYHTWYPPLKHALSLLSKLYGESYYYDACYDNDE